MTHKYPPIMLVDDNDNPIGSATLQEIHEKGLMHRAVIINVLNTSGDILLQKRALWVATNPGRWDASAAGHVDEGEEYIKAAKRELKEELGLDNCQLKKVTKFISSVEANGKKLNRFITLYQTKVANNTVINYDKHELLEAKWFKKSEVKELIDNNPESIVPEYIDFLKQYYL